MAEIHVQTKKNSGSSIWLWIVLAVIAIGALAYYLVSRNKSASTVTPPANTTGAIQYFVDDLAAKKAQPFDLAHGGGFIREPKALLS